MIYLWKDIILILQYKVDHWINYSSFYGCLWSYLFMFYSLSSTRNQEVKMRVHYRHCLYLLHSPSFLLLNHFSFSLLKQIFIPKSIIFLDHGEENYCIYSNCFFTGKSSPFFSEYFALALSVVYKYQRHFSKYY